MKIKWLMALPAIFLLYSAPTLFAQSVRVGPDGQFSEQTLKLPYAFYEELPPRTANFVRAHPSLQFIDVTEAAGSTDGNGYSFFRKSPWVSSDLIALLAYDLGAAQRGLQKDENLLIWTFPPDFIERLRKALAEINPEWAGATGKTVD
jgi:hypothetical protein